MQNRSFLGSIPPVTLNLIIINFIVWLAALTLPKIAGIDLNYLLGLHYIEADDFNVIQLVTYMFLHDTHSFDHIFFNMFSVFMFGRTLEAVWGGKRFIFYYLTTGIGAGLIQELAWEVCFCLGSFCLGLSPSFFLRHLLDLEPEALGPPMGVAFSQEMGTPLPSSHALATGDAQFLSAVMTASSSSRFSGYRRWTRVCPPLFM